MSKPRVIHPKLIADAAEFRKLNGRNELSKWLIEQGYGVVDSAYVYPMALGVAHSMIEGLLLEIDLLTHGDCK